MHPQRSHDGGDGGGDHAAAQARLEAAHTNRPGSAGMVQPRAQSQAHSARTASASSARRPHSSASNRPTTAGNGSSGSVAPVPSSPIVHVHSMLGPASAAAAASPSPSARWQSFESPSGRLREREKQLKLQRQDPNRIHWQASADYKYINSDAAVKLAKQATCDYVAVNARLAAQQQQQAEQQRAQRMAIQAEREAARMRAEEDEAAEALRIQAQFVAEQRRIREAEEDAQRQRAIARRDAAATTRERNATQHQPQPSQAPSSARSHKRNPTPVVPLTFVPAPRSSRTGAGGAAGAADRIAESEEDEEAEEQGGGDGWHSRAHPPAAATAAAAGAKRAHKRNPTPMVALGLSSFASAPGVRSRTTRHEPGRNNHDQDRIDESGDWGEEGEEEEEGEGGSSAPAPLPSRPSPGRSHKRNPTPMIPLSSFMKGVPPSRSTTTAKATRAAAAASAAARTGRIDELEHEEEEEQVAHPSGSTARLGPSSATRAAFARPSRSHKRNPTPMVPLSAFFPSHSAAAGATTTAPQRPPPFNKGARSKTVGGRAGADTAAGMRIDESNEDAEEADGFDFDDAPPAAFAHPARSHKRNPTPIIPLHSLMPQRHYPHQQRPSTERIDESGDEEEDEGEGEGADSFGADDTASATTAPAPVALSFRHSGRTVAPSRPARSHKRNPTPNIPPGTWAPTPRSRDMYAAWERIGETREAVPRPYARARTGADDEDEEEEPEQREDATLSLARRRRAAQLSRREKILRADLAEEGFEGDELDIPSEEEEDEEADASASAAAGGAQAGEEDGQPSDSSGAVAASGSAPSTTEPDPDAVSSDPDEEEAHMLELIDSTLSLALHEQSRGVTTPGPKAHIGVEQLTARRKHRRMDSQHPYAKVEAARQVRASLSKREMAAINAAVAAGGIAAGAAAAAAAASQAAQAASPPGASVSSSPSPANASSHPGLQLPAPALTSVTEEPLSLSVAPPATLRMFPPALVAEVEDAHRTLGQFIQVCQRDAKPLQGNPQAVLNSYMNNFLQLLAASGLDSNGYPLPSSSDPHAASPAAAAPPAHLALCASYLAVKICESGALSSHGSALLLQLLNTTLFGVFDVSFEEGARAGTGPPCKRTPFFTRLKHLQAAHHDVQKYKKTTEKRLRYNLRSLRLVISHSNRRFCQLAFRAWAYEVKMGKKRNKMYQLSLKKKQHKSKEKDPQQDDQMVSVFFYWRAHARTAKLQRVLGDEVSKLSGLLRAVRMEASSTVAGNAALAESIQVLAVRLHKLEEERLTAPIRPDVLFAPAFMEGLFGRIRAELDALRDADPAGFVPLYKLAPRHARKAAAAGAGGSLPGSPPASLPTSPSMKRRSGVGSGTSAHTGTSGTSGTTGADFNEHTDELLKQLSSLARQGHWDSRHTLFALIEEQKQREEEEERKNYHELSLMDPEDFIVLWTNFLLGHSALSSAAVAAPPPLPAAPGATGATMTALAPSEARQKEKRRLRDLSTDLRDSTLYMQLLQVLGPELPTHKVDKLFDLHSKAKLILSLSAMLGCRLVMSEWEYVEGVPDLHLLFLGNVLLARHGLKHEPKINSFQHKTNRLLVLRDHWQHLLRMEHVPPVTAYSFLGHLLQLCMEADVLASRHARRSAFYSSVQSRLKTFLWRIQRARYTGVQEELYVVRHINSRFHTYEDTGTIEELVVADPERARARVAYAQSQTPLAIALAGPHATRGGGGSAGGGSGGSRRDARPRPVQDDDTEVAEQVVAIKRLFANHRVELKKIQKHYATDPLTNQQRPGIDYAGFVQFCRDCAFLAPPTTTQAQHKDGATNLHINMGDVWRVFHASIGQGQGQGVGAAPVAAVAGATSPSTPSTTLSASASASTSVSSPLRQPAGFDPLTGAPLPSSDDTEAPRPSRALLTPSQFLDALIRLSDLLYSGAGGGRMGPGLAGSTLSARVAACIERDVLVGACRTVVDEFRQAVASESVRAVFKANKGKLSALFRRYSTLDSNGATAAPAPASAAAAVSDASGSTSPPPPSSSQSSFTMNFPNFLSMLADANLVDNGPAADAASRTASKRSSLSSPLPPVPLSAAALPPAASATGAGAGVVGLTPARLRVLFENVQQDEEYGDGDDPAQAEQLSYVEFLEALAALACWTVPDPFMPLATKLDSFLTDTLFAPLKRVPA